MTKRILCLISNMNAGGAETFLMKIYRTIDRSMYQMDFCVNLTKNYYAQEIYDMGGRIFVIPSRSDDFKKHNQQLANIITEGCYKYVMAISSNTTCYLDMRIAKKCGAQKCIVRSSNASNGSGVKGKVIHKMLQFLYSKYIDVMISPSDLAAEFLFGRKAITDGKVHYLHNAINYDAFRYNIFDRKKYRSEFGIEDDCTLIGHVGRFNQQKNHIRLIEIFKKYHQLNPKSKLLLIGIGDLQEQIINKVKGYNLEDCTLFLGLRSDVNKLLSSMDIFVLPSFFEGMPNVVIEAQANGLPCVISDSITKEANITGLVQYVSLEDDDKQWVHAINCINREKRKDTYADFRNSGYLIENVAVEFVNSVFE